MLSDELLKKVRRIEITTQKRVDDVLTGQYRSHFKGQGVQFSEHRLYVPGDDIRRINWNVSARTRDPLVKIYDEEREVTVFLIVDVSASQHFGSSEKLKSEAIAEVGGMLAYAASQTGDRFGALLFSGEVEHIIPPKKGRKHVLRVIRDLLTYQPKSKGTHMEGALNAAGRIMKHNGIVFVISDFIADHYEIPLKRLARKHDVVAVQIEDERESKIPEMGMVLIRDPESGASCVVDTSSYRFQQWIKDYSERFRADIHQIFKGSQIETLKILTKEDYGEAVVRFFRARSTRKK